MTVRESVLPDNIRQLLSAHLDFLHTTGQLSVRDMMGPLREYAQVGVGVSGGGGAGGLWRGAGDQTEQYRVDIHISAPSPPVYVCLYRHTDTRHP